MRFSVSRKCDSDSDRVFERLNSVEKVVEHEDEIEKFEIVEGNGREGIAKVRVEIFGAELEGRMRYSISDREVEASVDSPEVRNLEFGYRVEEGDGSSLLTQWVEFDTGSKLKNLIARLFFRGKIRKHMEAEVEEVLEPFRGA